MQDTHSAAYAYLHLLNLLASLGSMVTTVWMRVQELLEGHSLFTFQIMIPTRMNSERDGASLDQLTCRSCGGMTLELLVQAELIAGNSQQQLHAHESAGSRQQVLRLHYRHARMKPN